MGALLFWLIVGAFTGASALVLLLDWLQALLDPDPLAHEGFGLQVTIAVLAAWIFALSVFRIVALLRHREMG